MTETTAQDTESASSEPTYRHASVVRLTMDDPVNGYDEGMVQIVEGKCEDGVSHTVLHADIEGFLDIECEVLETFETDTPMTKDDLMDWAVEQANNSEVEY